MESLNLVAQIAAIIGAVVWLVAAPFEMSFYGRPVTQKFLHVETENVEDVRLWAFCIGARNVLAAAGTMIGLVVMWTGDVTVGATIVVTAAWYMWLAALAMLVADLLGYWQPRWGSVLGTFISGVPPLVVVIAA